jgi:hypothetical protein
VEVEVAVALMLEVTVAVGVRVGVAVAVLVKVAVAVIVGVGVADAVGVAVGVGVGPLSPWPLSLTFSTLGTSGSLNVSWPWAFPTFVGMNETVTLQFPPPEIMPAHPLLAIPKPGPDTPGTGAGSGDIESLVNVTGYEIFVLPWLTLPKLIFFGAIEATFALLVLGTVTCACEIELRFGKIANAMMTTAIDVLLRRQFSPLSKNALSVLPTTPRG